MKEICSHVLPELYIAAYARKARKARKVLFNALEQEHEVHLVQSCLLRVVLASVGSGDHVSLTALRLQTSIRVTWP